ncbi:MAG: AI-2E family transporter [Bacteroidetes bacterium SW_9_63_38]|nr:MAG: AI-2E family transporter [Bacteroidetes bacterium SW_9_63_38]
MTDQRSFARRVFIAVGIVAVSLLTLYLLVVLSRVLLIVFAGVLMAVGLGGGAETLRMRIPLGRPGSLTLVILLVVLVPSVFSGIVGPSLTGQVNDLIVQLPEAVARFRARLATQEWTDRLLADPNAIRDLMPSPKEVMGGVTSAFSRTLGVVANVFVIVFIGIYGAAAPDAYTSGIAYLTPTRHRERAHEVLAALAHALRWWLIGRLTMMSVVGVLTTLGLWISGVPTPLALGLLAALLSFVPYVGPILSFIPAVLVALMVSLTKVAYVVVVFGIVQTLESYVITPLVQQRAVSLPPVILITAQIAMGVLAGATGVLLAAPLAVVVIVLLQMLYVKDVLGDSVQVLGQ